MCGGLVLTRSHPHPHVIFRLPLPSSSFLSFFFYLLSYARVGTPLLLPAAVCLTQVGRCLLSKSRRKKERAETSRPSFLCFFLSFLSLSLSLLSLSLFLSFTLSLSLNSHTLFTALSLSLSLSLSLFAFRPFASPLPFGKGTRPSSSLCLVLPVRFTSRAAHSADYSPSSAALLSPLFKPQRREERSAGEGKEEREMAVIAARLCSFPLPFPLSLLFLSACPNADLCRLIYPDLCQPLFGLCLRTLSIEGLFSPRGRTSLTVVTLPLSLVSSFFPPASPDFYRSSLTSTSASRSVASAESRCG